MTSKRFLHLVACAVVFTSGVRSAQAAVTLFDFEVSKDLAAFHDERKTTLGAGKTVERVEQFATSGRFALKFATPKWKTGLPQWPAFEADPPVTNWSGFDRLVFEVTNPGEYPQKLSLFITDSKIATRQGLAHHAALAPFSHTQVVIPLARFAESKVNPADIRRIHFFTTEPPGDMAIFLDHLALLKKDEPLPTVPVSYLRQFGEVALRKADSLRTTLAEVEGRVRQQATKSAVVADWAGRALAELKHNVAAFREAAARGDAAVLKADQAVASLRGSLERLESLVGFRLDFEKVRPQLRAGAASRTDLAVGFATSMEKVLPRDLKLSATVTNRIAISLARNEKESFQVLVAPFEWDLKGVAVRIGDLRSKKGILFAATNIHAAPVGYVETKSVPPYGSASVGWWPDPILDFLSAADIAKGDVQSFWVRVRAPKGQTPGQYHGTLELWVDGAAVLSFDLAVRVYPFQLPDVSPLPLAITFAPHDFPAPETKEQQAAWRKLPDYPLNAWKKHKLEWADFLADYYITYDSLYHHELPDPEVLAHLHQQGRLGKFNLGYYDYLGTKTNAVEEWKTKNLPRLRAAYEKAKALGVLDHAYIYGCDEVNKEFFPRVQAAAEILKAELPGVPVMTTTYDQSYGLNSVIQSMDSFCPLTPSFDPAKAAQARVSGKQVWWYICCGPHHPNLNMFIEYPAIEGRLLMGAMTAKYRPDGFLYYQISIWNSRKPITGGPFTDWDPRSWTTYHGDGSWTCVGPDGVPLATVRLENFRDGLEDYAYVRIMESAIKQVEASAELRAKKADWLKQAKGLLEVPADLLKSKTEFTRDPSALYRWRNTLAETIEAGM